jgi:tryptophan-rich sensory protein
MTRSHATGATRSDSRGGSGAWLALLGWLALAAAAGAVGAIASRDAAGFYGSLAKPVWAPPGWLFGPVWSALYVLMGVAAWLVWRARPLGAAGARSRRLGLALFVAQLALNALWTWIFFAWRQGAAAFGEILLLWIVVALTAWQFGRVRRPAAYCLIPYLGWVTFAAALTWAVWRRNPDLL